MKVDIFSTENKYRIIYADPPWRNPKSGTKARNNEKHYPSMPTDKICKLPIESISESNSILFIWICFPCLEDSFDWCKIKSDGMPKIGCGYYTRQNNELCLVGVKHGMKNRTKPLVKNIGCSILEQPREHSRKPDIVRENIVKICGNIPRIELFARQEFDGWDCWGNEV